MRHNIIYYLYRNCLISSFALLLYPSSKMTAIAASVHIIQIRLLHTRSVKVFSILIAALILGGVIGVMASLFYYPSQPSPLQYNIVSESGDNSNSLPVVFQNA